MQRIRRTRLICAEDGEKIVEVAKWYRKNDGKNYTQH